ncbi:MAG: hypothetical protein QM715_16125 [Nibricoccus sp.]
MGIALESDHVGRRRIVEKIGVDAGKGFVGEEGDGDFARGAAAAEFLGVLVERLHNFHDRVLVELKAGVGDVDVDLAGHEENKRGGCNFV